MKIAALLRLASVSPALLFACRTMVDIQPTLSLDELWQRSPGDQVLSRLDDEQLGELSELGESLFAAARRGDTRRLNGCRDELKGFALQVGWLELDGGQTVVVFGRDAAMGIWVIRLGRVDVELMVQAPHRFFDRHTGTIARHLFESARWRALYVNTEHRYADSQRPARSDQAHAPRSPLSALTRGAARAIDELLVLQVHGFAPDLPEAEKPAAQPDKTNESPDDIKRDSPAGPKSHRQPLAADIEAIVSPGVTDKGVAFSAVVLALQSVGIVARQYPEEVDVLGGTQNAQGRLLAELGRPFVHLELNPEVRERLKDKEHAGALATALTRSLLAKKEP